MSLFLVGTIRWLLSQLKPLLGLETFTSGKAQGGKMGSIFSPFQLCCFFIRIIFFGSFLCFCSGKWPLVEIQLSETLIMAPHGQVLLVAHVPEKCGHFGCQGPLYVPLDIWQPYFCSGRYPRKFSCHSTTTWWSIPSLSTWSGCLYVPDFKIFAIWAWEFYSEAHIFINLP
jgi:hypothetical protein